MTPNLASTQQTFHIPTDLLLMIFEETMEEPRELLLRAPHADSTRMDVEAVWKAYSGSLLSLISVCRQWRAAAFATSALWDTIHTPARTRQCEKSRDNTREYVAMQLEHSGNRELTLFESDLSLHEIVADIIDNLQALDRVRQLYLWNHGSRLGHQPAVPHYPMLERLFVAGLNQTDLEAILPSHPNIKHLTLRRGIVWGYMPPLRTAELSQLESLTIRDFPMESAQEWAQSLFAPKLHLLHLHSSETQNFRWPQQTAVVLHDFAPEMWSSIRKLVLGDIVAESHTGELLSGLENLEVLEFVYPAQRASSLDENLWHLTRRIRGPMRTSSVWVPKLQVLAFHNTQLQRTDIEKFAQIRQRMCKGTFREIQLSNVTIVDGERVSERPVRLPASVTIQELQSPW
ncbi:hypothetical protein CALCODRAFT_355577 [Calocera cornea HHB12733]|uniref:Uncharacterized protein n=1 Tax=Calocera cornea HHB12733 TaxID=1353952 RepID=A0A165EPS3_9BASI|nr:hypothetical protein CALCODRAFT_355577 [Calocera cornea HHB12733]